MSSPTTSSPSQLRPYQLHNLSNILRTANAHYRQIASIFRSTLRRTYHAKQRATKLGLTLNIAQADDCPQTAISNVPLPILETTDPVTQQLTLVIPARPMKWSRSGSRKAQAKKQSTTQLRSSGPRLTEGAKAESSKAVRRRAPEAEVPAVDASLAEFALIAAGAANLLKPSLKCEVPRPKTRRGHERQIAIAAVDSSADAVYHSFLDLDLPVGGNGRRPSQDCLLALRAPLLLRGTDNPWYGPSSQFSATTPREEVWVDERNDHSPVEAHDNNDIAAEQQQENEGAGKRMSSASTSSSSSGSSSGSETRTPVDLPIARLYLKRKPDEFTGPSDEVRPPKFGRKHYITTISPHSNMVFDFLTTFDRPAEK